MFHFITRILQNLFRFHFTLSLTHFPTKITGICALDMSQTEVYEIFQLTVISSQGLIDTQRALKTTELLLNLHYGNVFTVKAKFGNMLGHYLHISARTKFNIRIWYHVWRWFPTWNKTKIVKQCTIIHYSFIICRTILLCTKIY